MDDYPRPDRQEFVHTSDREYLGNVEVGVNVSWIHTVLSTEDPRDYRRPVQILRYDIYTSVEPVPLAFGLGQMSGDVQLGSIHEALVKRFYSWQVLDTLCSFMNRAGGRVMVADCTVDSWK